MGTCRALAAIGVKDGALVEDGNMGLGSSPGSGGKSNIYYCQAHSALFPAV
jgi:hypothetical protein